MHFKVVRSTALGNELTGCLPRVVGWGGVGKDALLKTKGKCSSYLSSFFLFRSTQFGNSNVFLVKHIVTVLKKIIGQAHHP